MAGTSPIQTGSGSGGTGGGGGTPSSIRPFPGDYFVQLNTSESTPYNPAVLVNDPNVQEVFVSDPAYNKVDVLAATDLHSIGSIPVANPLGMDLSLDGQKLYVAGQTKLYIISPSTMHVVQEIKLPDTVLKNGVLLAPYAMADGTVILALGPSILNSDFIYHTVRHLCLWDPGSNAFTMMDPPAANPALSGDPARTRDGKHLIVPATNLYLYSTDARGYVATGPTAGIEVAASPDGSQYASLSETLQNSTLQPVITFLDAQLKPGNQVTLPPTPRPISAPLYSPDGKYLYGFSDSVIEAFDTSTQKSAGFLYDGSVDIAPPRFMDVDAGHNLIAIWPPGGVEMLNASHLAANLPAHLPDFSGSAANLGDGPVSGGTTVQIVPSPSGAGSADGITDSFQAYFGSVPAASNTVGPYLSSSNGMNALTAVTPPAKAPGPVAVTITDADNNVVFLPNAFSYGPRLSNVIPTTASPSDPEFITVYGYGLGSIDPSDLQVTVGGKKILSTAITVSTSVSAGYPEEAITFPISPATPGWADITVTTPSGSDTLHHGLQFVAQQTRLSGGPFDAVLYDQFRDRFYLTGQGNTIQVFDPSTLSFAAPLSAPGVPSTSVFGAETITPDGHYLVVTDPDDQSVVAFDLKNPGQTQIVKVATAAEIASKTTITPGSVVAAAAGRVFISTASCVPYPVRELDLTTWTVSLRSEFTPSCIAYDPYPQKGVASKDGNTVIFDWNTSAISTPQQLWKYDAGTDQFTNGSSSPAGPLAVNDDASVVAVGSFILDGTLQPMVSGWTGLSDVQLNGNGSLLYAPGPQYTISIRDTHHARILMSVAAPINSNDASSYVVAVEPDGSKMLVANHSGINFVQLQYMPLSVGTISPATGPAGTAIQVTGSGFSSGTTVKLGGQLASCTTTDAEDLTCTVPQLPTGPAAMFVSSPDGQNYSLEGAFLVQ